MTEGAPELVALRRKVEELEATVQTILHRLAMFQEIIFKCHPEANTRVEAEGTQPESVPRATSPQPRRGWQAPNTRFMEEKTRRRPMTMIVKKSVSGSPELGTLLSAAGGSGSAPQHLLHTPLDAPQSATPTDPDEALLHQHAADFAAWTEKQHSSVVYDSAHSEYTQDAFYASISGKQNLLVVMFTAEEDVFGVYITCTVRSNHWVSDNNVFVFTLRCHDREKTPQRWSLGRLSRDKSVVWFPNYEQHKEHTNGFLRIGRSAIAYGGELFFGGPRSKCYVMGLDNEFEGINKKVLTGKSGKLVYYEPRRLVVLHVD